MKKTIFTVAFTLFLFAAFDILAFAANPQGGYTVMKDRESKDKGKRKVHVEATYTSTAEETRFVAERGRTVGEVIAEAYAKLGESPRDGDQHYCVGGTRLDLAPHRESTLEQLSDQGVCLDGDGRGKAEMVLEIDTVPGGAGGWRSLR